MSVDSRIDWVEVVKEISETHDNDKHRLLAVLQDIQLGYGCVTPEAQIEVAVNLALSPTQVSEVVSFYHFLYSKPKGQYVIWLCQTISCDMADKAAIVDALEEELNICFGETTEDGMFALEYTNCIGMCDQAPAMLVNDDVHVSLTPDSVRAIIADYRQKGGMDS